MVARRQDGTAARREAPDLLFVRVFHTCFICVSYVFVPVSYLGRGGMIASWQEIV
jgi:hypothetical protein